MNVGKGRCKHVISLLLALFGITMSTLFTIWWQTDTSAPQSEGATALYHQHQELAQEIFAQSSPDTQKRTLVIYVYHESDEATKENLNFFLKVGVGNVQDPFVDYVIVVNGESAINLTGLPLNVQVVRRGNACYDGGTAGEVLANMDIRAYRFFFIMNSSVRGPFLPAYFSQSQGSGIIRWTTAFTDLLTEKIKLVGTTISCERRVHVQSMLLATDRVGLGILQESGALDCAKDRDEAIINYELGASAAIMGKGYSFDCLMLRYAGVDWLSLNPPECNKMLNPYVSMYNDGMSLNPLEVLFVKIKANQLASDHVLQRWSDYVLGRDDLSSSHFNSPAVQRVLKIRRQRLIQSVTDCHATFDYDDFVAQHPDLKLGSPEATYQNFLDSHLFVNTTYRYTLPEQNNRRLKHHHCHSIATYGAPDLSG